ncbi:hypothetical protein TALC_01044 [Thermoplasmatales archaeon BRNA1]|nr:hypothetical protein TALC_01044 [Thermoplasmatales archaeon BRNA1]
MNAKIMIAALAVVFIAAGSASLFADDSAADGENIAADNDSGWEFYNDDVDHDYEINYKILHILLTIGILAFAAYCVYLAIYAKLYGPF